MYVVHLNEATYAPKDLAALPVAQAMRLPRQLNQGLFSLLEVTLSTVMLRSLERFYWPGNS